jgi:hypothetical protein
MEVYQEPAAPIISVPGDDVPHCKWLPPIIIWNIPTHGLIGVMNMDFKPRILSL